MIVDVSYDFMPRRINCIIVLSTSSGGVINLHVESDRDVFRMHPDGIVGFWRINWKYK